MSWRRYAMDACCAACPLVSGCEWRITFDLPFLDLVQTIIGLLALGLAPWYLARRARRSDFDRNLINEQLQPSLLATFEVADSVKALKSDAMPPADRERLVSLMRSIRLPLERSVYLATHIGRSKEILDSLSMAVSLARELNRLATGGAAHTNRQEVAGVAQGLTDELLKLLRRSA